MREEPEEIDEPICKRSVLVVEGKRMMSSQFADSLEIDRAPFLSQCLDIIEEVNVAAVQHDLLLAHWR